MTEPTRLVDRRHARTGAGSGLAKSAAPERSWSSSDAALGGPGPDERLDRFEAAVAFAIREATRQRRATRDETTDVDQKAGVG